MIECVLILLTSVGCMVFMFKLERHFSNTNMTKCDNVTLFKHKHDKVSQCALLLIAFLVSLTEPSYNLY